MTSSSPPCFAHELAENPDGSFSVVDEEQFHPLVFNYEVEKSGWDQATLLVEAGDDDG